MGRCTAPKARRTRRARLEEALAIFDRLGARKDAARVEQAIADLLRN